MADPQIQTEESLWYKDAVIYELHVKSFYDSNGDGIGDFEGLIHKLDYLQELGVTALWLLPFYPSPLLDDGYDISDYFHINPDYGTMVDFRRFLREAHQRGIRVITELAVNHTSSQHKWFQRSRQAARDSLWRDFYVWSDTPDKYKDARIIFTDFETSNWAWDPVAHAYYWHRFYSHQPDLNYDNPRVRRMMLRVLDYRFSMGVDGLRLDAVPYLYEREGTNCENLPETHAFLKELRAHVDTKFKDRMLLAEANQWPEDAAAYFGNGDECHMAFYFPIMPRLFMAVRMEDRFPIIDILEQGLNIPPTCQWAMFLRNHDELTLEMVTDEERAYMYKAYAQDPRARINVGIRRRLAPLLNNNRRVIELMNSLLLSLPGTPILYYGDEIGMGDNYHLGDRDGVRTPMQWNADMNAAPITLALLLQLVPNQGDAWTFALDNIDSSLTHAMTLKGKSGGPPELPTSLLSIVPDAIPSAVRDFIGPMLIDLIGLLGRRTGELHLALMSLSQNPDVTPEPFSLLYQKSLYQSIRGLTLKVLTELENSLPALAAPTAEAVKGVLARRQTFLLRVRRIIDKKIRALKIRTHGDYHLGQVLYTGKDFVIIDFEGEPTRSFTERRLKQSALRDVAAMVRSFHYAAQGCLILRADRQSMDTDYLRHWADLWYFYVSGVFLHAYRRTVADSPVVPTDPADFAALLETFILEKAVYELGYELNHRPDWLMIPVRGIEQILKQGTIDEG